MTTTKPRTRLETQPAPAGYEHHRWPIPKPWEPSGAIEHFNTRKVDCPRGHEYNEENTYKRSTGKRLCRVCDRDAHRARYWRLKKEQRESAAETSTGKGD